MNRHLDAFQSYLEGRGRSPRTIRAYLDDVRRFLVRCPGEATTGDVDSWAAAQREAGLSSATICRRLAALRVYYDCLARQGLTKSVNPVTSALRPKCSRHLPEILSEADIEAMRRWGESTPMLAQAGLVVKLLWGLGLRVSELAGLKVEDVDLTAAAAVKVVGKGDKVRHVPIPSSILPSIQSICGAVKAGSFLGLSVPQIRSEVKRLASAAGITKRVYPHLFRHAYCTALLEGGADIRDIQEAAGHASIVTTQIYAHVSAARLAQTIARCHPLGAVPPVEKKGP